MYSSTEKYNSCRLVRVSWILSSSNNISDVSDFILKPDNFKVTNKKFHNLTHEECQKKGKKLSTIIKNFLNDLATVDAIVGHNIYFHLSVILSELSRKGWESTINKIISYINANKIICTSEMGKPITKIIIKNECKAPRLQELYYKLFGKQPENLKSSIYKVFYVMNIFKKVIKNSDIQLTSEAFPISKNLHLEIKNILKSFKIVNNPKKNNKKKALIRIYKHAEGFTSHKEIFDFIVSLGDKHKIKIIDWSIDILKDFRKIYFSAVAEYPDDFKIKPCIKMDKFITEFVELKTAKSIKKAHIFIHKNIKDKESQRFILIRNLSNEH